MRLLTRVVSFNRLIGGSFKGKRTYGSLSYIHNIGTEPLRQITIGNLVETAAQKYPDREVVVSLYQNKRITYQQLLTEADKLAAGFRTLGLEIGDKVGLWAPNLTEWVITAAGAARAGCILVSINPVYLAKELEYCINKVGIKTLVCASKIKNLHFYDILNEVAPELQKSKPGKLNCANIPSLKNIISISENNFKGAFNFKEFLEISDAATIKSIKNGQHLIQADSISNIQFTSGTTGQAKATTLSHFNIVNNAYNIGKRNELDKKHHKICVQIPFFHTFGTTITILASFIYGSTMVLPSPMYNSRDNLKALQDEKCTIIHGTPTMYIDLINVQKEVKADINPEIAVSGASPCSPKLFRDMQENLKVKKVKSVFGQTETSPVCFQSLPVDEDEYKATATVGYIHDHLEAKVVDENNNIVPIGTIGELCIRGYSVMLGYWGDEAQTKQTIGADGWLKTGDQFVLQEDGYGRVVGRIKDMIIRGGENIYPNEIEYFLTSHPDILESQIIGLSHERLGEEVCACVRLKDGAQLTQESLAEFCKGKIANYKIPSQLRIVDSFPKTASGKIQKYILKQ